MSLQDPVSHDSSTWYILRWQVIRTQSTSSKPKAAHKHSFKGQSFNTAASTMALKTTTRMLILLGTVFLASGRLVHLLDAHSYVRLRSALCNPYGDHFGVHSDARQITRQSNALREWREAPPVHKAAQLLIYTMQRPIHSLWLSGILKLSMKLA